ncbi:hypothetical protein C8R44DRAFT_895377 [Mycena epipterygia]|nr:hypothetical protein C8R44DRAFT_895377 [Mycena epipterygia]
MSLPILWSIALLGPEPRFARDMFNSSGRIEGIHQVQYLASLAVLAVVAAQASFYESDGQVGACGTVLPNSDLVIAVSSDNFANGAHCGELIAIAHGTLVGTFIVEDECTTCEGDNIGLTSGAFQEFAPLSAGTINVTYTPL